jgi:hypothetical protein
MSECRIDQQLIDKKPCLGAGARLVGWDQADVGGLHPDETAADLEILGLEGRDFRTWGAQRKGRLRGSHFGELTAVVRDGKPRFLRQVDSARNTLQTTDAQRRDLQRRA